MGYTASSALLIASLLKINADSFKNHLEFFEGKYFCAVWSVCVYIDLYIFWMTDIYMFTERANTPKKYTCSVGC